MEDTEQIDSKLSCNVCGEEKFHIREGFYYCNECGTKQNQVRAVEVECEDSFNETKYANKKKITAVKSDKFELTSWECYNYILRGLVDDLLTLGAKEEFKLMSLQVWAAYLKRNEVVFFNKKLAELPKLGVRYLKRDSELLYNHSQKRRRKLQRERTNDGSSRSAESNSREWRRKKRKLDESEYSLLSVSQTESQSSNNNSSSSGTTRGIQLKFSSLARRQYKKIMPIKHLKKHERDSEGQMTCHNICPKARALHRFEYAVGNLSLKLIYTILAIALNLVEDEIQLTDFVRFINEDRLRINNVAQYFPDNIAPHCNKMLKEIGFFVQPTKCSYKILREEISIICKFLHINLCIKRDIFPLVQRYVTELNLPNDIAVFVERLINLLPPKMKKRAPYTQPSCEARAMAYIIFVLKILFGLDGHKENFMSEYGKKLNKTIETMEEQPVFIWSEWMEYVEMRKVIVSQYNRNFCRQFNQFQSKAQLLAEITEEQERQHLQANEDLPMKEINKVHSNESSLMNLKHIFETFSRKYNKTAEEAVDTLSFPPSYTPAHSYFKRILLHVSINEESNLPSFVMVPQFMRIDHMQRSVRFYLQPKPLRDIFHRKGFQLKIVNARCTSERSHVGVFRPPLDNNKPVAFKADFNISEEEWLKNIPDESHMEKLEFKTKLEKYHKDYIRQMEAEAKKRKRNAPNTNVERVNNNGDFKNSSANISASDFLLSSSEFHQKLNACNTKDNINESQSSQLEMLKDCNTQPIKNFHLNAPRRNCDNINLFENVSSGIESNDDGEDPIEISTNEHVFVTSSLDYWVLIGHLNLLNDVQKKVLEKKFSRSFFWLLETCAQTIGVDWSFIYEQLLVIEFMFVYGIEPLGEGCVKFRSNIHIKDINHLILLFRAIW